MLNPATTIQATAYLLTTEPHGAMNYMRLLKLLYIVERELLRDAALPMTGDTAVAMQRGPVLSAVYDAIRGQGPLIDQWHRFFQTERYILILTSDPGTLDLAQAHLNKLKEVATRYADMDEWDMSELTHTLPEWRATWNGVGAPVIPLRTILAGVGRPDVDRIVRDLEAYEVEEAFFAQL